jgi:hypothetical protein
MLLRRYTPIAVTVVVEKGVVVIIGTASEHNNSKNGMTNNLKKCDHEPEEARVVCIMYMYIYACMHFI